MTTVGFSGTTSFPDKSLVIAGNSGDTWDQISSTLDAVRHKHYELSNTDPLNANRTEAETLIEVLKKPGMRNNLLNMVRFFLREDPNNWALSILPLLFTTELEVSWTIHNFDTVPVDPTPYFTPSRVLSSKREKDGASLVRSGLAIIFEADALMSPDGREAFLNELRALKYSIAEQIYVDVIDALLFSERKKQQWFVKNAIINPRRIAEILYHRTEDWGIVQKHTNPFPIVNARVAEKNRKFYRRSLNVDQDFNTWIIVQKMIPYLKYANSQVTDWDKAGPRGQQIMGSSTYSMNDLPGITVNGMTYFTSRSYDTDPDRRHEKQLNSTSVIGQYYPMIQDDERRFSPAEYQEGAYKTGLRRVRILSEEEDDRVVVGIKDAIKASQRFKGDLISRRGAKGLSKEDLMNDFLTVYSKNPGFSDLTHFIQMEEKDLSHDSVKNDMANSLAALIVKEFNKDPSIPNNILRKGKDLADNINNRTPSDEWFTAVRAAARETFVTDPTLKASAVDLQGALESGDPAGLRAAGELLKDVTGSGDSILSSSPEKFEWNVVSSTGTMPLPNTVPNVDNLIGFGNWPGFKALSKEYEASLSGATGNKSPKGYNVSELKIAHDFVKLIELIVAKMSPVLLDSLFLRADFAPSSAASGHANAAHVIAANIFNMDGLSVWMPVAAKEATAPAGSADVSVSANFLMSRKDQGLTSQILNWGSGNNVEETLLQAVFGLKYDGKSTVDNTGINPRSTVTNQWKKDAKQSVVLNGLNILPALFQTNELSVLRDIITDFIFKYVNDNSGEMKATPLATALLTSINGSKGNGTQGIYRAFSEFVGDNFAALFPSAKKGDEKKTLARLQKGWSERISIAKQSDADLANGAPVPFMQWFNFADDTAVTTAAGDNGTAIPIAANVTDQTQVLGRSDGAFPENVYFRSPLTLSGSQVDAILGNLISEAVPSYTISAFDSQHQQAGPRKLSEMRSLLAQMKADRDNAVPIALNAGAFHLLSPEQKELFRSSPKYQKEAFYATTFYQAGSQSGTMPRRPTGGLTGDRMSMSSSRKRNYGSAFEAARGPSVSRLFGGFNVSSLSKSTGKRQKTMEYDDYDGMDTEMSFADADAERARSSTGVPIMNDSAIANYGAINNITEEPLTRLLALMFYLTPARKSTLLAFADNNVVVPVNFLVFKTTMVFDTFTGVCMVRGSQTGNFYLGYGNVMVGADEHVKVGKLHYTQHTAPVIREPLNVHIQHDMMIAGYQSGSNAEFIKDISHYDPVSGRSTKGTLISIMVPYEFKKAGKVIDASGNFRYIDYKGMVEDDEGIYGHYPSAAVENAIWGFRTPDERLNLDDETATSKNTVLWQGRTDVINPITGLWDCHTYKGYGHLAGYEDAGSAATRKGNPVPWVQSAIPSC